MNFGFPPGRTISGRGLKLSSQSRLREIMETSDDDTDGF